MLHTKFHGNRPAGSGEELLKGFNHIWASWPSWLCDQHHVIRFHFLVPESFKQNLVQIGTEVSEKIQFEFLYLHILYPWAKIKTLP